MTNRNPAISLGEGLAIVANLGVIVGLVFVFGILRGEDSRLMLMTALSLAVAVVPEGLPAVVTLTTPLTRPASAA